MTVYVNYNTTANNWCTLYKSTRWDNFIITNTNCT